MTKIGHNRPPLNGYILIARKLLNHPVVGAGKPVKPAKSNGETYSRLEAWLDLLMMAVYEPATVIVNGHKYDLERGDQVCAVSFLSKRWNWTKKTVEGFLQRLLDYEMLERKGLTNGKPKDKRPAHLSVCNYKGYQDGAQDTDFEKGNRKGNRKGNSEGKEKTEVTLCKNTINMFPDAPKGQSKGEGKGEKRGEQYKTNNKTNKKTPSEQKKEGGYSEEENRDIITAFEEYNQLAKSIGLSKAISLNATRKKHLAARLKEHGLDGWRLGLDMIDQSKFLCGSNNRGYKANLDFMLQASSYTKLLEGFYRKDQPRRSQRAAKNSEWEKLKAKYAAPPPIISEDAR